MKAGDLEGLFPPTAARAPVLPASEIKTAIPAGPPRQRGTSAELGRIAARRFPWSLALRGVGVLVLIAVVVAIALSRRDRDAKIDEASEAARQIMSGSRTTQGDRTRAVSPGSSDDATLPSERRGQGSVAQSPERSTARTFKGLSIGMTPREVNAAAPRVNADAVFPDGVVRGFWPNDDSSAPVDELPTDASGLWHYGYSIPARDEQSKWTRRSWVCVGFDGSHQVHAFALKFRTHIGPPSPFAIALTDLRPAELARQIADAYRISPFSPNPTGTGWEFVDRDAGWKVEFVCVHWTTTSAQAGAPEHILTWDDSSAAAWLEGVKRQRIAYDTEVRLAKLQSGLAASLTAIEGLEKYPDILISAKLDAAWVLQVQKISRSGEVKLD